MLTSEVLNRAADLIEERGWGQGCGSTPPMSGVCIVTSISRTGVDECVRAEARRAVTEQINGAAIIGFNDAPERTASEVIEVLRAAAAIEQARESQPSVVQS